MRQIAFEQQVTDRLRGLKHLEPVFSDIYEIARRIREYDSGFFIVWNSRRKKYEIHSLNHIGNTYGFDAPNNRLDARVELLIRKNNIRLRGRKIFQEIDKANERLELSNICQRDSDFRAIAGEMRPYFRKVAWEGG